MGAEGSRDGPTRDFIRNGDVIEPARLVVKNAPAAPQPTNTHLPAILFGVWACGFVVIAGRWVHRWVRARTDVRAASPLPIEIGIPVVLAGAARARNVRHLPSRAAAARRDGGAT